MFAKFLRYFKENIYNAVKNIAAHCNIFKYTEQITIKHGQKEYSKLHKFPIS